MAGDLLSLLCRQHMMRPQLCARIQPAPTFITATAPHTLPHPLALSGYTLPSSSGGRPNLSLSRSVGEHSSCPHKLREGKKG